MDKSTNRERNMRYDKENSGGNSRGNSGYNNSYNKDRDINKNSNSHHLNQINTNTNTEKPIKLSKKTNLSSIRNVGNMRTENSVGVETRSSKMEAYHQPVLSSFANQVSSINDTTKYNNTNNKISLKISSLGQASQGQGTQAPEIMSTLRL